MIKVYTFGYGFQELSALCPALERENAVVMDVRLNAWSQRPEWRDGNLRAILRSRYVHCPDWGNTNHKDRELGVNIRNYGRGLEMFKAIEASGFFGAVVLMCGCVKEYGCHRKGLGDALRGLGYEVQELELGVKA